MNDGLKADTVLADKSYDCDRLRHKIKDQGGQAVIPPRKHRKVFVAYDEDLYKGRDSVEGFFNKIRHVRRVVTRCDKLLVNFLCIVKIAAFAIWLR